MHGCLRGEGPAAHVGASAFTLVKDTAAFKTAQFMTLKSPLCQKELLGRRLAGRVRHSGIGTGQEPVVLSLPCLTLTMGLSQSDSGQVM